MRFRDAFIPYSGYWSTPFCKWQGSLSLAHPLRLAANCASRKLDAMSIEPAALTGLHFGMTVPQHQCFYGAPWVAAMLGAAHITGPTISQACATSARVIASAASACSLGSMGPTLALTADRISNGPHLYYPNPAGPGGMGQAEDWVMDNFSKDPYARVAMVDTAENIAAKFGFERDAQDALTLIRYGQYQQSLANDRAFQRRYMMDVTVTRGRSEIVVDSDEGVTETTADGLARLKPVKEDGSVTYATQTHPADGNAGLLLCSASEAVEFSNHGPRIEVLSYGEGRAEKAHMGMAVVPAAASALQTADVNISQVTAFKTHNPFVVNDLYFAREFDLDPKNINNFGSSLIFGHPQGPTGMRLVIELIEELVALGGGIGVMTGCAAGDTGAAIVIKVS